jgi:hypothetical protein
MSARLKCSPRPRRRPRHRHRHRRWNLTPGHAGARRGARDPPAACRDSRVSCVTVKLAGRGVSGISVRKSNGLEK